MEIFNLPQIMTEAMQQNHTYENKSTFDSSKHPVFQQVNNVSE